MATAHSLMFHQPSIWLLLLLAGTASCGSMAAWWVNDMGPSLIMQDDESGGIRYSLCNTNSTPIFPNDTTLVAPLDNNPPKQNTSLAGAGWYTGTDYFASIFYQDTQDRIVNSLLQCDTGTGQWYDTGDYVISDDSPKVSPTTGLAVILLGSDDGYRVFYNDLSGRVHSISYMRATAKWLYNGLVSPDKGGDNGTTANVIAATFPNDNNITIITPRDGENMEVSRIYGDDTWHISTFPTPLANQGPADSFYTNATNTTTSSAFTLNKTASATTWSLPAWDGKPAALAMAEDKQYTRSVFYVGTDDRLHQIGNVDWEWQAFSSQGDAAWPAADAGRRQLAVASDFDSSQARVYYISGGGIVEASSSRGIWTEAKALPSWNETAAAAANGTAADGGSGSGGGDAMSSGAKAGIGVGVSLGVFAIGGSLAAFLLMRRSQRKKDAGREKAAIELQSEYGGGASPAYSHSQQVMANAAYHPAPGGYNPQQQQQQQQGQGQWPLQQQQGGQGNWGAKPGDANSSFGTSPAEMETSPIYEMDAHYKPLEMMGEGHYQEMGDSYGNKR